VTNLTFLRLFGASFGLKPLNLVGNRGGR